MGWCSSGLGYRRWTARTTLSMEMPCRSHRLLVGVLSKKTAARLQIWCWSSPSERSHGGNRTSEGCIVPRAKGYKLDCGRFKYIAEIILTGTMVSFTCRFWIVLSPQPCLLHHHLSWKVSLSAGPTSAAHGFLWDRLALSGRRVVYRGGSCMVICQK